MPVDPSSPPVAYRSEKRLLIPPPVGVGTLHFTVLASLRAAQLMRGCRPKVGGTHKPIVTAQIEISTGEVSQYSPAAETTIDGADAPDGDVGPPDSRR